MNYRRFARMCKWVLVALPFVGCVSGPVSDTGTARQKSLQRQLVGDVVPETDDQGNNPRLDPNGIPLNPMWGYQYNHKHQLVPDWQVSTPPDIMSMCNFDIGADPVTSATGCTSQRIATNLYPGGVDIPFLCPDPLGNGLNGHLNWMASAVTVEGPIIWDGHESDSYPYDGDFNVKILPIDPTTRSVTQNLFVSHENISCAFNSVCLDDGFVSQSDHVLIEFNDGETAYRYPTPDWFGFANDDFVASSMINSGVAAHDLGITATMGGENHLEAGYGIVTGLFGVDGVHSDPLHTEIHPAFAFSFLWSSNSPGSDVCKGIGSGRFSNSVCHVDRWAAFVRGAGNEGNCGPGTVSFPLGGPSQFKVRYPWLGPLDAPFTALQEVREGLNADGQTLDNSGAVTITPEGPGTGTVTNRSVMVSYDFADPPNSLAVEADLSFVYGSARIFDMKRQITSDGGWPGQQWFLAEDFTGDGVPDMAHAFNNNGFLAIDVYTNSGGAVGTLQPFTRWTSNRGLLDGVDGSHVLAADFTGDGLADIVHVFRGYSGKVAMSVIATTNGTPQGFLLNDDWSPEGAVGDWTDDSDVLVADFTGDRRPDIAYVFKNGDNVSIDIYENDPTARSGNRPGFRSQVRWLDGGGWTDHRHFLAGDFDGDGRVDVAHVYRNDAADDTGQSLNVYPFSANARGPNAPGFAAGVAWASPFFEVDREQWVTADFTSDGRADLATAAPDTELASITVHESLGNQFEMLHGNWATDQGGWSDPQWLAGDFNNDCAPDMLAVFNDNNTVSVDNHNSLFVPSARTVDFAYVPPDMTVTTCNHPNIGLARPVSCNPHPGSPPPPALSVTNDAPQTFSAGQNAVVWTVSDPQQLVAPKQVTQIVTVVPQDGLPCSNVVQNVTPANPSFEIDVSPPAGVPDGWTAGGAYPTLVSPGYSGNQAVKLTATQQTPNVFLDTAASSFITPVATAGLFLHVHVAAYTSGFLTLGSWEGNFASSTGGLLGNFTDWSPPANGVLGAPGRWKTFDGEYPIPVGSRSFRVRLRARTTGAPGQSGYIIFDDLQIKVVQHS